MKRAQFWFFLVFHIADFFLAYEYVPDSEIASVTVPTSLLTAQSESEEDLLMDKVYTYSALVIFRIENVEMLKFSYSGHRTIFPKCLKR